MKKQLFKRFVSLLLVVCMVLGYVPAANAASVTWKETDQKITAEWTDRLVKEKTEDTRDESEMVRVSIVLEEPSTVGAGYATMGIASNPNAMAYRDTLLANQKRMEKTISHQVLGGRSLDVVWNMTLVGNIISAWVPYGSLEKIAAIQGIKAVAMEARYEPAVAQRDEGVAPTAYPSGEMIGSGTLWNSGYTGAGTRIAIVDTGTDTDHQSFDNGAYLHALEENAAAKGMSYEQYITSLDLLTPQKIAEVLPDLNLYTLDSSVTAEQLYYNEKLAFGYNYVDATLDIVHDNDQQGEHGSHVAGIATANRYIPLADGSYADARDAVMMLGVAPDAQLITMKVFGEGNPYDSDYMAAIEDAILLDCDVVNLSMGTTMPGSPYTDVYNGLMEMLKETDTVVAISAGNAYNWAEASSFGYLYNDDVSFDTVGAPGSYDNAFTVASVDNAFNLGNYFAVGEKKFFYAEQIGYGNSPFADLDTSPDQSGTTCDYVFLDGLGYEDEYADIDVLGKIVLVSRGTLNFGVKANNALARGAVGVVIYNNEEGLPNMDLSGLQYAAPVISITQTDAGLICALSQDQGTHLTGKLTVFGEWGIGQKDSAYYTMSEFSSWGVPGSLTLKPEITAPGGQIYSVWGSNAVTGGGSDQYETMSGTSMAAPQVTGMSALLAQVYQENGLADKAGISPRHLAQSLLMSTAQPLYEEKSGGNYYSLMKQGAGLARVDLAAQADSFIKVDGQDDYKVKAELGDDPERTGVYTFDFTITNITDSEKAYTLDADLFRQDVFEYQPDSDVWLLDTWTTGLDADVYFASANLGGGSASNYDMNGDGTTNAADADYLLEYIVGNKSKVYADADISGDGNINSYDAHLLLVSLDGQVLTVPAKDTATVQVTLKLSEAAKAKMDAETPKGTYVEAFVYVRAVADAEGNLGTNHSIPVLAFYGDWSEPSMYDRGTLIELTYMATNIAPYLYQQIGSYGNTLTVDYGDGKEYYYGGNPVLDDDYYIPERNAFNSEDASKLIEQGFTLIRGAGAGRIQITNADTGEVYFQRELGELYPTYYNLSSGRWENTIQYAKLNWSGKDAAGDPLIEGTKVNVTLTTVPYYYRQADGSYSFDGLGAGSTMTTTLTIDNTAPKVLDIDTSRIDADKLTVKAQDNRYVAAIALLNANGSKVYTCETPNQTVKNSEVTVDLDLAGVYGNRFLVAVYDYANNVTVYEAELNLGSPERDYFTAIDYSTMDYVSVDMSGQTSVIAATGLSTVARAAEYVDGYVFIITEDNRLAVANDEDLTVTEQICQLDPYKELLITSINDLAYNHADGKLYVQYYSQYNSEATPYLATIDMGDGSMEQICELPTDVNTMAIATDGTFYSAGYNSNILYKYTLADILSGKGMTQVGEMGYYNSAYLSSMAWDHNTGKIYWTYPNTLVEIDPKTAEPTLLGYHEAMLVGIYTRPAQSQGRFDPVDTVDRLELSIYETRVMLNSSFQLEATVWPWNASDRTVTWTTSDASVATVDAKGVVTGLKEGKCTITATSNLDASVSASCTIEVFRLEKTLNAIIWDEDGEIWMSEFSTADLQNYTKLSSAGLGNELAAATIDEDGDIYAASLDVSTLKSDLYKLDSTTYEATKIGPSADGYVDLAPAPGQGEDRLMAAYGGNVLNVDATTGDYYNWYYMFDYNLVGLAYVGTEPYTDWGYNTSVDWYFVIDRIGTVYLLGFLEQNGSYFYLEHDRLAPDGIYTRLDFEMDTAYYGSAYFDGEMLYYSAYKESQDNVTLMAIDVAGGSKACYEIGTFADGVWPVAGLMELGKTELDNNIDLLSTSAEPVAVEQNAEFRGIREEKATGSLNNTVAPMSDSETKDDLVYVNVTLPYDGTNADMTVTYDTGMLELVGVDGSATAFAWNGSNGKIRLSLAEARTISTTATVARLTFRPVGEGQTIVSIVTNGLGEEPCGYDERITVPAKEHMHDFVSVVTEPTCTEQGYTTHTCSCGDFYVSDYVPALGHDWEGLTCKRCGEVNMPFVDVPSNAFFYEPVIWAVEQGITNGYGSADTFAPDVTCNRGQVVTFLWRAAGEPEPTSSVNPFTDIKESDYFYKAVLWAVEEGITAGYGSNTIFNPNGSCTRGQVATFLWRFFGQPQPASTENPFTDVKSSEFYYTAVLWAAESGITAGYGNAYTFAPNMACNRGQIVTFLYRAMN